MHYQKKLPKRSSLRKKLRTYKVASASWTVIKRPVRRGRERTSLSFIGTSLVRWHCVYCGIRIVSGGSLSHFPAYIYMISYKYLLTLKRLLNIHLLSQIMTVIWLVMKNICRFHQYFMVKKELMAYIVIMFYLSVMNSKCRERRETIHKWCHATSGKPNTYSCQMHSR